VKRIILFLSLVIVSLLMTTAVSASAPQFGISSIEITQNDYKVIFFDNSSLNVTVAVETGNLSNISLQTTNISSLQPTNISYFNINSTTIRYFNITQNTILIMIYNNHIVATTILYYKSIYPTISAVRIFNSYFISVYTSVLNKYFLIIIDNGTPIQLVQLISHYYNFTLYNVSSIIYLNITSTNNTNHSYVSKEIVPSNLLVNLHYTFSNIKSAYLLNLTVRQMKDTVLTVYINNMTYIIGAIRTSNLLYNFTIPYTSPAFGTLNSFNLTVKITNTTVNYSKTFFIKTKNVVSLSDFSLSITPLSNNTYEISYTAVNGSRLLVRNSNNMDILNTSVSSSGILYVSYYQVPSVAVLLYYNTPEIIQQFPAESTSQSSQSSQYGTRTVIVYEGINDTNAILIIFASFFGSLIVAFAFMYVPKSVKYNKGNNKSEILFDKLKEQPLSNVDIRDANLLKYFVALVSKIEEAQDENKKLKEELEQLETKLNRGMNK